MVCYVIRSASLAKAVPETASNRTRGWDLNRFLRVLPTTPTSPVPSNSKLEGSGTDTELKLNWPLIDSSMVPRLPKMSAALVITKF